MKTANAISTIMTNVLSVAKIPPAAVTASQTARITPRTVPMIRPMYPVCTWRSRQRSLARVAGLDPGGGRIHPGVWWGEGRQVYHGRDFASEGGAMRLLRSATALAAGLVFATAPTASASRSAPVLVSGPSPYAGCAGSDAGQPGRDYLNGEAEPYVAVDPVSAKKMIGMFHQDRWSNGGAHGIAGAYSTSGGAR